MRIGSPRALRAKQATLDLVIEAVKDLLNEQLRRDGEVCKLGFEQEFAKLQGYVDQMENLIERLARLDRAAGNEPVVDSVKMN